MCGAIKQEQASKLDCQPQPARNLRNYEKSNSPTQTCVSLQYLRDIYMFWNLRGLLRIYHGHFHDRILTDTVWLSARFRADKTRVAAFSFLGKRAGKKLDCDFSSK